ncbi:DUF2484 family protein [Rubellimicrobium roseum]|uniref:DUF2484 family protein n=1 Tax=Rubellimicrobium roseum TaxID=687525 RepID=A0A5C4NGT5_9RHOB|nr:DUF2484 family protein [Rubellimicrobium roseum]TNC73813.1 DUF2484 family protein [Rubellimicrobium roseum]
MSTAFLLACLWFVTANIVAMLPTSDGHWRAAVVLIVTGVPLLGWLTVEHGPVLGMLALAGGASVLRWPLVFLWRWLRRGGRPRRPDPAE